MMHNWKQRVKKLKQETYTLYYACKDSRLPWYTRLLAICVVAYLLSPIDLIPDFIPVLGYLDDLLLVPIGIILLLKLIPEDVIDESREKAITAIATGKNKPTNLLAAGIFICIWILTGVVFLFWLKNLLAKSPR
ncbi:YkvA family protein [Nostoc sp.]|uniref:YkvA family protein n=1 Tax=Nostoc sp. TaxID=1180 RepID=UPI0035935F6B